MKGGPFWLEVQQRFRGTSPPSSWQLFITVLTLKMETIRSSETTVELYRTARCYSPGDRSLQGLDPSRRCRVHWRILVSNLWIHNKLVVSCLLTLQELLASVEFSWKAVSHRNDVESRAHPSAVLCWDKAGISERRNELLSTRGNSGLKSRLGNRLWRVFPQSIQGNSGIVPYYSLPMFIFSSSRNHRAKSP